jgi:hypothetical protein
MSDEPDLFSLPDLPYAGTSGWSGSSTSLGRALREDEDGTTSDRQRTVLRYLADRGAQGATWRDLADRLGYHHGSASGALSVLHKTSRIERLTEKRNRCKVYVLPEYVNGRDTEPHGGRLRGTDGNVPEVRMLSEHQAQVMIEGHDALVHRLQKQLTVEPVAGTRNQAERVIDTIADWLTDYRPPEVGDMMGSPLDVAAFILRKGEARD